MKYKHGNIDDFIVRSSPESDAENEKRGSYATKMSNIVPALSNIIGWECAEYVADAIIAGKIPHVKYIS